MAALHVETGLLMEAALSMEEAFLQLSYPHYLDCGRSRPYPTERASIPQASSSDAPLALCFYLR